jgi:hypothetical protein
LQGEKPLLILNRRRKMDVLKLIFDKNTLREADKIAEGIKQYYEKTEMIVNLNPEKRPKMNFLFYLFPYFFKEDFPDIDNGKMEILCHSAGMCIENVMFYDNFLDSDFDFNEDSINNMFEKYLFNQYQIRLLCQLFGEESEFWGYFDKYHKQYFEALRLERRRYKVFKEYSFNEYKKITRGIYSLWKYQIAALGCLSSNTGAIKKYEEVLDLEATASQLFDDLKDWKDDFKEKRYSWMITRIMSDHGLTPETDIKEISEILFKYNYDSLVLGKINRLCESIMLKAGNVSAYIRKIRMFQYKINKLNKDLINLKGINEAEINVVEENNHIDNILRYGLENFIQTSIDLILIQRSNNYPELVHWIAMPASGGLTCEENFAGGYVYQRVFILNLLIELKKMGYLLEDKVIKEEVQLLIDQWEEEKGGWSYFKGIREALPDIDILAEFIKLCSEFKDPKLEEFIERSVDNAIRCKGENQMFGKWITGNEIGNEKDNNDYFCLDDSGCEFKSSENDLWDRVFSIWGNPCDPASNASIVYALNCYDSKKYGSLVKEILSAIEKEQNEVGGLKSEWYLNNWYTSYLMAKLIRQAGAKDEVALKLLSSAKAILDEKDLYVIPLNYAFASLILLELDYLSSPDSIAAILEDSMKNILKGIGEENFWSGTDFLNLKFENKDDASNTRVYKSSTFNTAICIYTIAKAQLFLNNHTKKGEN